MYLQHTHNFPCLLNVKNELCAPFSNNYPPVALLDGLLFFNLSCWWTLPSRPILLQWKICWLGYLEIAYFNWPVQGCHQDFKALGIDRVLTSYTCMKLFWNSLVSYLKIAAGHAHTDCNSPRALVAALNETLMSNDNFKSALPLTILADLPFRIVGDRMTLSKCGARATLIECRALPIFGLIIIAGFTRYTFLMSIFIYTNHSTSMAGPCITCCNKAYHS